MTAVIIWQVFMQFKQGLSVVAVEIKEEGKNDPHKPPDDGC